MRQRTIWLSSFGAGAAAAFLFDPVAGKRRRHRMADATTHLMHRASDAASTVRRDLSNRTLGVAASVRRRLVADQPDDSVIEERVHSALGRLISHPHAITVKVNRGRVILDGPLSSTDEHRVLCAVRAVPGVTHVESRFDPHIQPAHEPSSEAARPRARTPARADILQRHWAPATRALAAGAGAALVGTAVVQRNRSAVGPAAAGAALIARAVTNLPFRRLVAIGAGRVIDVQKPPGGVPGHAIATLFGSDPKTQLDEDLVRMKTTLGAGHRAHDVARPE